MSFDQVSYAYFTAFLSLLSNMELIKKVISIIYYIEDPQLRVFIQLFKRSTSMPPMAPEALKSPRRSFFTRLR